MLWAIFQGQTLTAVISCDESPTTNNSGHDMTGKVARQVSRAIDSRFESYNPQTGAIIQDATAYNAVGQALIDSAYEKRVQLEKPAKAAEHARKLAEALAYQANPVLADTPLLTAEATATGVTPATLAQLVIDADSAMRADLDDKAVARRAAVTALRAASTIAAKKAVVQNYLGG